MRKFNSIARAILVAAVATVMLAFGSVAAQAHAELEASNPIADSVIGDMPPTVELSFGEVLMVVEGADGANQVTVTDADGKRVDVNKTVVSERVAKTDIKPDAAEGVYTVAYRVVSEDGHPIEGSFKFEVSVAAQSGEAPVATPVPISEQPEGTPPIVDAPVATLYAENDGSAEGSNALPWIAAIGFLVVAAAALFVIIRKRKSDAQ